MLYTLIDKMADAPRQSLFTVAMAAVVGVLLSSMYLVCDAQVRSAQAYHVSAKAQRQALYDCLDNDPRASYAACASHVATIFQPQQNSLGAAHPLRAGYSGYSGFARSQTPAMLPVAYYSR